MRNWRTRPLEGETAELLSRINLVRRSLIRLRRQLAAEIVVLEKLLHPDLEFLTNKSRSYLKGARDRLERVLHLAEVNKNWPRF